MVSYVEIVDEPPVQVVQCTPCRVIFNRETGEVLSRDGNADADT